MYDPLVFRPSPRGRGGRLALGIPLSIVAVGVSVFTAALFWLPHGIVYEVGGGRLAVTYGMRSFETTRTLGLDRIGAAERVRLCGGRKLMGTNLPGYCQGRFRYADLGEVWQATDCSANGVIVRPADGGRPWVLSPAGPAAFVEALEEGRPYRSMLEPVDVSRGSMLLKLVMLLPLVLAGFVPVVLFVAPWRLCYRIVPGGLEVSTVLRTRRYSTTGATARRHSPRPGFRLWGSGMPGYFTGWFFLDSTRSRVFATGFDDGVLIEGGGLHLFVNPVDTEGFLGALRSTAGVRS